MWRRMANLGLGVAFLVGGCRFAFGQAAGPDEEGTRHLVDTMIAQAPGHRATLGVLEGTMALSISFGAPAWNAGDHDACCRFYMKTGQSLCDAFGGADGASGPAREVLDELKGALDRCSHSTDADANAWTMRFVFDKTQVAAATEADGAARLVELGQGCFSRGQYADAQTAFEEARDDLKELEGEPAEEISLVCRFAPVALSDALFAQGKYEEAADAAEEGIHFVPEWAASKGNIRQHFPSGEMYDMWLTGLRMAVQEHPGNAKLEFLLGYHLYFGGQKGAAEDLFRQVIAENPKDEGALALLGMYDTTQPS